MIKKTVSALLIAGLLTTSSVYADTWWDDFQDSYFCSYADAYAVGSLIYAWGGLLAGPVGWAFTGYSIAMGATALACNWPGEGPG